MTQDERWFIRYDEVKTFIAEHHRNPSKYAAEERNMYTFVKHCRKQLNQGLMKEERVEAFKELVGLMERYRRVNQWG